MAIYVRISKDREGAGLGVERQERECRELAEKLNGQVVAVHRDNDLSAYSGKPRPGYRQLLQDIRDGKVDLVLAWHSDRLHRSPAELEEWIATCEPRGVPVHTVKAGPLDLATPSGRMVARQLGAVARYEVDHMIERQKSAKAQAAAAGKWRGGRRPFGYESDGVTVRPEEAKLVAEATDRVLAGEALSSVARDFASRSISTSAGTPWDSRNLRNVLLRARNAGIVEHEGTEVGPAEWPAIVDPAKWRNVRRLLTAEGRRAPRSSDLVYLGSGLYLCGYCGDGTTMRSAATRTSHRGNVTKPAYRCRNGSHLTRIAEPLDQFVSEVAIERLSRPDSRLLLAPEDRRVDLEALHARREDNANRLKELAALFGRGVITGAQLTEATTELRAESEELDAEIASHTGVSPLVGIADAVDVRAAWNAAGVGKRKAVVRSLMDVTLMPAPKGRPPGWQPGKGYFDPRAVRIEWKQ